MKQLILLLFLIIFSLTFFEANAQNTTSKTDTPKVFIGIRGGISIPNLTAASNDQNPLNTGYSSRFGPDAGVYAEFKISGLFSIQPGLEYSSQGGKKDGLQALPTPTQFAAQYPAGQAPTYLYATFNSAAKLNYIMLPILAKIGFNFNSSPLRVYIDAGPFFGYLVYAKQVTSGTSDFYADPQGQQPLSGPQSFNNTTDIKDQLHKGNFGIEGSLGFSYALGKGYFFIEGGGNYGFMNIQKGTANGQNNAGAGTVSVVYAFALK